ncbi:hypothetical protein IJ674_00960 [bacterium]|nr:hypothetical protein [bacterium]
MKVDAINLVQYNRQRSYITDTKKTENNNSIQNLPVTYPALYFTGSKITDIDGWRSAFIRRFDEILKEDAPEEEINQTEIQYKGLRVMMRLKNQLEKLYAESEILWADRVLNPQQKYSRAMQIKKEVNAIKNVYDRGYLYIVQKNNVADEKTDYVLINKFKSSVSEDNFNLEKVFKNYYQPMNDIHSIKELKKKYPKIHIPQRPEDVIARKLESRITRDFYEDLDDAFILKDKKRAKELISSKVMQLLNDNIKIKSPEEKENAYKKLIGPTVKTISARYYKLHNTNSFSSVPEFRKQNKNLLSENDIKLLGINYEDFVLSVLKEQYTNFKTPNDIVYSKNGTTIKVSSIKDSDYKFEKIPSRIAKLIQDSEKVRTSQRDYKNYTTYNFKKKLEFYAEKFDESERLLHTIVQFDSCLFGDDDIKMLIKFLQEADKVWDGEKTIKELEEFITDNSIKPAHTERINAIEEKKRVDAIKTENKKIATLRNLQENFDAHLNILYENNLNYLAEIYSKYKPSSLDEQQIKIAKTITDTIDKNVHSNTLKNKEKAQTQLMRVSRYIEYLTSDNENPIFKNAVKYAASPKGETDIEKAGKYILNAEFIKNYPQSLELASNKEVAEKIAQESNPNKAVEYLCKYDDYRDLNAIEKTKISNILNIFDTKDSTEKFIVKNIVENDYLNTDTSAVAKLTNDGSKKAKATMGKNAKNQIYEHYKFPKSLMYFDAFEDALTHFAVNKNSSGIKKVLSTDANELKIKGHDDRLFAYNNSFYFDEFSLNGLH